jgi:hypothetical protein
MCLFTAFVATNFFPVWNEQSVEPVLKVRLFVSASPMTAALYLSATPSSPSQSPSPLWSCPLTASPLAPSSASQPKAPAAGASAPRQPHQQMTELDGPAITTGARDLGDLGESDSALLPRAPHRLHHLVLHPRHLPRNRRVRPRLQQRWRHRQNDRVPQAHPRPDRRPRRRGNTGAQGAVIGSAALMTRSSQSRFAFSSSAPCSDTGSPC